MLLKRDININGNIIKAGTHLRVIKQTYDHNGTLNKNTFLWQVCEGPYKNYRFFTSDLRYFREYKRPVDFYIITLKDYILNNWSAERMLKAGLFKLSDLNEVNQIIKYKNELLTN